MNRQQRRQAGVKAKQEKKILIGGVARPVEEAFQLGVKIEREHSGSTLPDVAAEIYRRILAVEPDHYGALNNLGCLESTYSDPDAAIALFRRAIHHHPERFGSYNNLARALSLKGEFKEAEAMYRHALSLKPELPRTLHGLSHIRKYTSSDHDDVRHMHKLLQSPGITSEDREYLHFALGKVYDDCGEYEHAFEHYDKGNKIIDAEVPYNAEMVERKTGDIIKQFSKEFMAQRREGASEGESPVFIIGMPRSGTTLVETILTRHPQVGTIGESPAMITCAERVFPPMVPVPMPFPMAASQLAPAMMPKLITFYEDAMACGKDGTATRIINKHPINFRYLGFIAPLFPKARFIHCARHPMDTCLSNYFQRFGREYDFAFNLRNIGHFYGQYMRLMEHWKQSLPGGVLDIVYENMVSNTEATTRSLLEFLGLPWNERCLSPQDNARAVRTSSMSQVRQPIYKRSVERWRNYEKHLGELKEALGSLAD